MAPPEGVSGLLEKLHLKSPKSETSPASLPSQEELAALKQTYADAEQGHVFTFYDTLDDAEKASFVEQLKAIDPKHVNDITAKALNPTPEDSKNDDSAETSSPSIEPLPADTTASLFDATGEDVDSWYSTGLNLISANKVAVVLMAGGQGTRLGSSDPKGCFDIGLPSGKSLFQLQAERILKVQRLAAAQISKDPETVVVPWYVMTSGPTRAPTEAFFAKHKYFGLSKDNVVFFEQGVLPCISNEGKILLSGKGEVAVAPDGNGGLYNALLLSGVLADMKKRGVEHVHAYCVDNCLVRVADPIFMGFGASKGVSIATKVVRKRDATEPVGLIVAKNGLPGVIEYSEMDKDMAEARISSTKEMGSDDAHLLKFRAANIVNHYYSIAFLDGIPHWSHRLPHHVARKKIPYIDLVATPDPTDPNSASDGSSPISKTYGTLVKPDAPNGIKLEQFVFDCFLFLSLDDFACFEVRREDEFSPLKNGRGKWVDDADTSRRDILAQGSRWVSAAKGIVVGSKDEDGVEVSPLISYGGEGLGFLAGREIKAPAVIEKEPESK